MNYRVEFYPKKRNKCSWEFTVQADGPVGAKQKGRQQLAEVGEVSRDYKEPIAKEIGEQS